MDGRSATIVPPRGMPGLVVTGLVRVDLRRLSGHGFARAVQDVSLAPAGAEVVVHVRRGQTPPRSPLAYLHANGGHLGGVRVESDDPATVARWVHALRGVAR